MGGALSRPSAYTSRRRNPATLGSSPYVSRPPARLNQYVQKKGSSPYVLRPSTRLNQYVLKSSMDRISRASKIRDPAAREQKLKTLYGDVSKLQHVSRHVKSQLSIAIHTQLLGGVTPRPNTSKQQHRNRLRGVTPAMSHGQVKNGMPLILATRHNRLRGVTPAMSNGPVKNGMPLILATQHNKLRGVAPAWSNLKKQHNRLRRA
jgi:hypothetical protein